MELSNLDELVHFVSHRRKFLNDHPIACPKCRSRDTHLTQIKFLPRWRCYNCQNEFIYEPIKLTKKE